jgi:hypothetical protein
MGKSRLADKFGETCPMINFTLGQANFKCYPPVDGEVRSFLCKEMPEEIKKICDPPKRNRISSKLISEPSQSKMSPRETPTPQTPTQKTVRLAEEDQEKTTGKTKEFVENLAITTWNHTRAAALLQACFEVCKLYQLSISLLRSVADADLCSSQ